MKLTKILGKVLRGLWYLPKTIYINFVALPLKQAVKLPIVIMSSCWLRGIKRKTIVINGNIHSGMIKIGAQKSSNSGIAVNSKTRVVVRKSGKIYFDGDATFGKGTGLCVDGGMIHFGKNFSCNVNCFIACSSKMNFKEDVLLGWNVNIRDDDGHQLWDSDGKITNCPKEITIGNHVWIASFVDILKGVSIADNNIIGYRSLVTKSVATGNNIIAGVPAKIVRENMRWEH